MSWYRNAAAAVCLSGFALAACGADGVPATILMDGQMLAKTRMRIEKGDPGLKPALDNLIAEADAALGGGPYSVTDKQKITPSGDKHDYASYGRYWWPDPSKPDGLPYIQRDGETNPDSQSPAESDRPRIESMSMNTETLGPSVLKCISRNISNCASATIPPPKCATIPRLR